MRVLASGFLVIVSVAGCGNWHVPTNMAGNLPRSGTLVPDSTLRLTSSLAVPLDKVVYWGVYAGVAYLITDPLAPNWQIEEASFPGDAFHLSLHMKRYYAGGAGEARQVFHQRAKELVRQGGYGGYEVLEYNEGLDSSLLGSQRVASGVVRLLSKPEG